MSDNTASSRGTRLPTHLHVSRAEIETLTATWGDPTNSTFVDQLPMGLIVIDKIGTVRAANSVALDQLGWDADDAVGRSLLDVIVADDLDFAAAILDEGEVFYGSLLGPIRIGYHDGSGRRRFTEFWARELDDRSGYVMAAPLEATSDMLADAARAIARSASIDEIVGHIVASLAVSPMDAEGCVLRVVDGTVTALTPWKLGTDVLTGDRSAPWAVAMRSGRSVDVVDVDQLQPLLRQRMIDLGYGALWCRPVADSRDDVVAVIVVVSGPARPPSPNQQRRLDDVIDTTTLAFDRLEHRSRLEPAAFIDDLTGVGTRRHLRREIAAGIRDAAVAYLDLDGFQDVNGRLGHEAGDQVLCEVARRLSSILRPDDLVIRAGGDEFVLVIREGSEFEGLRIAATIVDELAMPYRVDTGDSGHPIAVEVTASVGLCVQCDGTSFDDALQEADDALTEAKRAGKHRIHVVSR